MDDEWDEEIFGSRTSNRGPGTTHCDVPLKFSNQRAALGKPAPGQFAGKTNRFKREYRKICDLAGDQFIHHLEASSQHHMLLNGLNIPARTLVESEFNQQQQAGDHLWSMNLNALRLIGPLPSTTPVGLTSEDRTYLLRSYHLRCFYEEAVLASGSKSFIPSLWWTRHNSGIISSIIGTVKMYVGESLFLIQSEFGSTLLSRDHLTIYSDLASQRFLLRRLAVLQNKSQNPSFVSPEVLEKFLENGDLIIHYGGNGAYKIIYGLEPQCLGELVGDIPVGYANAPTFAHKVHEDLLALAQKYNVVPFYLERMDLISDLRRTPNLLSQIYGLYRIWGHPTVEPLGGASALKNIVTKVRILDQEKTTEISNRFKEEFIIRYIQEHKHWPELDCSNLMPNNVIRQAYESQGLYPKGRREYKRSNLNLIKFEQCFPVDPKFDLVEMISDKALSLRTDELISSLSSNKGVGSAIDRSVLVKWLESGLHDPLEFLTLIDRVGFPDCESSIGLREKEREGKVDARMFGLTTLFKRMYIVLTEAMLSEHIIPLFPEITMVDDEITLDKKRHQFTKRRQRGESLFTSLDFSKWNSNMREEETLPVFQDFDHLFGFTRVFTRTHEMFKTSFMYLLNGSYLPTVVNSQLCPDLGSWRGHLGGIEGLRQKGWTIWTVILILVAAENHPVQISLMGQGDNQVLKEVFSPELTRDQCLVIHFQLLKSLNDLLSKIGPPLKMEETWTSWDLYVYGKYIIYKGAPLITYAKRLCRMFRMANEDYPTLESALSSLTANLSSGLACSHTPGELYFIYVTEVTGLFQLFFRSSFLHKRTPKETLNRPSYFRVPSKHGSSRILAQSPFERGLIQPLALYIKLALLPRPLGGYPICNLLQVFLRGFPDEVSLAISSLKLIYRVADPKVQSYIRKILNPPLAPDQNYKMLFEHPTALNLHIPPSPSESRRNLVVQFLQETPRIQNPFFKTFINLLRSKSEEPLIEYLTTAVPFNPRMLGQICAATAEARATHLAGRLQATKTISTLAREEGGKDIYSVVAEAEMNHLKSVFHLILRPDIEGNPWTVETCSLSHARTLRNIGWKKDIEGVDCVPPYEFMVIEDVTPISVCKSAWELDKGYIAVKMAGTLIDVDMADPTVMGSFTPYRGSVTRQKVSGFGDRLAIQADPLLTKVLRLFSLIGWAVPGEGNLAQVIQGLLRARTDLDPHLLTPDSDQIAGSIHHRLQDERSGHGGSVSILPNFGSKFMFDTFPLTEYSKGSKNVNLMFQSIMSISTVMISWRLSMRDQDLPSTIHIHVASSCCVRGINESFIECPEPPRFGLPVERDNPYLFIKSETLLKGQRIRNCFPVTADPAVSADLAQSRLISTLAQEIISIIRPEVWGTKITAQGTRGLLINWALRCPLLPLMENVTLFLSCYYLPSIRRDPAKVFLMRLHERVMKSPLPYWIQLSNLLFCPDVHHELVAPPYKTLISGNPCLTPAIFGANLRSLVANIALTWATTPSTRSSVSKRVHWTSPFCGLSLHPSLILLTIDYLNDRAPRDLLVIRRKIITFLDKGIEEMWNTTSGQLARDYVKKGRKLITGDSLDTLCKRAPEITPKHPDPRSPLGALPEAVWVIGQFQSKDLVYVETRISQHNPLFQARYRSHSRRPLAAPTSGPYKGLSLLAKAQLRSPDRVLCVGDGAGGFTWSALRFFPTTQVMFNTLAPPDNAIQQAPTIPYLPSLAGWSEFEHRLLSLRLVNEEISDITHPSFPTIILNKGGGKFDLVMCDAECPDYLSGRKPLNLALAVRRLGETVAAQTIIFKTYALSPLILRQQVSIFLGRYNDVMIVRSHFSSDGSTEVYLICSQLSSKREINITDDSAIGYQLPEDFDHRIQEVFLDALSGLPEVHPLVICDYTVAIDPDCDNALIRQLAQGLPFALLEYPLYYPHSVSRWIGQTTMKVPNEPSLSRRAMETTQFKTHFLIRWAIGFLSVWTAISEDNSERLETEWNELYLVWFRLNNGFWMFSLYSSEVPPSVSKDLKAWKINWLLTSMHLKVIHRLKGLLDIIGVPIVDLSGHLEVGDRQISGQKITEPFRAKEEWARKHIQIPSKVTSPGSIISKRKLPFSTILKQNSQKYRKRQL